MKKIIFLAILSAILTGCGGEKRTFTGTMTLKKSADETPAEQKVDVIFEMETPEKGKMFVKGKGDWEIEKCEGGSDIIRDMVEKKYWVLKYCDITDTNGAKLNKAFATTIIEKIDGDKLEMKFDLVRKIGDVRGDTYTFSGTKK
jgi:hypothetical protein